jgi:hypothetical protein
VDSIDRILACMLSFALLSPILVIGLITIYASVEWANREHPSLRWVEWLLPLRGRWLGFLFASVPILLGAGLVLLYCGGVFWASSVFITFR